MVVVIYTHVPPGLNLISWVKSEEIISMGETLFDKVKLTTMTRQVIIVIIREITCAMCICTL